MIMIMLFGKNYNDDDDDDTVGREQCSDVPVQARDGRHELRELPAGPLGQDVEAGHRWQRQRVQT